jgi:hypothetical protein
VARAKEKYAMGLTSNQCCGQNKPQNSGNIQNPPRQTNNNQQVPMDVDATNISQQNFKKLTPEEWAQLAKEGQCFRCQLQGHLARDCPKNKSNATVRETNTTNNNVTTTAPKPNSTPVPNNHDKLTRAQRIRAMEEEMDEEEHAVYLDACDMGQDFWVAKAITDAF